jgi:nitroreductase
MDVYEAILKRRTIRKFKQDLIPTDVLEKLVNAARLAPSGANLQPIKYVIINDPELLPSVFSMTRWAAYIAPKGTPQAGEEPTAYIAVLADREIRATGYDSDAGAAIENLILTAVSEGIGSCWLGSIDREGLRELLQIPENYHIHSLIALGYPAESPVAEDAIDSIKYYRDENGTLHVPKRTLAEVMFVNRVGN